MGGDEGAGGRELPAEMSPLPLFPGGFWPGAESPPAACWCPSHGRLPRAGASFSGRWKRLLANHRRKPQRCSGRRWAVGSCLPAAQGQSGAAPPPQEWGAPRELPAHVSSCLCWLSLPGAEPTLVLTSSFAVLAACWVTALLPCRAGSGVPGGCVLTTPPSAFSCLGTHEVAAIFPLRSKSLHFQPVLAVRVGGAVRGEGGLGAAGALGKTGAEGPYEMQGKAAGRPDPLLSTRL